jgi:hypothetical protein
LPEPFGPTTQVIPGSSLIVVADAKDLKPLTVWLFRCTDLHGSADWVPGYGPGTYRAGYRREITQPGRPAHHNRVSRMISDRSPRRAGLHMAARRWPLHETGDRRADELQCYGL